MAPRGPLTKRELEDLWRQRLDKAFIAYRASVEAVSLAIEDFNCALTPIPDGTFGIRKTLEIETAARSEYMRVLKIFTDLAVNGIVPQPDGEDGKLHGRGGQCVQE